jgi:hypothetical protein
VILAASTTEDRKYWDEDPAAIPATVGIAEANARYRQSLDRTGLRLYYNRPARTVATAGATGAQQAANSVVDSQITKLGGSLTQEIIDGLSALICRPLRARVLPVGAKHSVRLQCKQLQHLVDGVLEANDFLAEAQRVFVDSGCCSLGAVQFYIEPTNQEIRCERVDPLSLYWLDDEGANPLTLIKITGVSRRLLALKYPKHKEAILRGQRFVPRTIVGVDPMGAADISPDQVKVIELWRRKVGDKPGRHVMAIISRVGSQTVTELEGEGWDYDSFPFAFLRYQWEHRGFGGVSVARLVGSDDLWYRRLNRVVYESLKGGVPLVWKHINTTFKGVSDLEYQIAEWDGEVPPEIRVPQVLSKEVVEQMDKLRMRAMERVGLNSQLASGVRPPNLPSQPAQNAFVDTVTIRLLGLQQRWEAFYRQAARCVAMLASTAYKSKGSRVKAPGSRFLELVKWPVDLKENQYDIQVALASALSLTVSGRLQDLQTLKEAMPNTLTEAEFARQLQMPDTEGLADRLNSAQDLAEKLVSMALDGNSEGKPQLVMPPMRPEILSKVVEIGAQELAGAYLADYPRLNRELLRRLIRKAEAGLKALGTPPANTNAAPATPAPAVTGSAAPPAVSPAAA